MASRRGTSLIDLLISMAVIALLFGGIYLVYFSIVTSVANIGVRTAASSAIQAEIETIRNLPYDSVGTVGGIPSGVIPQTQTVAEGKYTFTLTTTVRNIDDPFDGTVSGNPPPVDTAPADYKLVAVQATCAFCESPVTATVTTTVAPKNLESASQNGSLFLYVLDANGAGVPNASIHVVNASVTPSIDLTDTTNASGTLQLVGVPTSTQNYQITVTKPGYSTEQTYPPGAAGNPNPVLPNATVAAQTVTALTFSIDRLSTLTIETSDDRCNAVPNESFSFQGTKLIGTSPNVLKFSTTSATDVTGAANFSSIEWDTYSFALNDATRNVQGTIPLTPLTVNPSTTVALRFVTRAAANPALLVMAIDASTQAPLSDATVTVTTAGTTQVLTTGHSTISQTDWSGGQFASSSAGIDAGTPGTVTLLANASGSYPTAGPEWLISNTFDLGGSQSHYYALSWNPLAQPAQTALSFQVAANNDNATWNFVGPDGTAATYFTTSGTAMPAALAGNRYFRYKAILQTSDASSTPSLADVTAEFAADCVPPGQALFQNLPTGSYTVDITAANYLEASTTVSVGTGYQTSTLSLTHA